MALAAGVDMSMVPSDFSFPQLLVAMVQNGSIPEARIDESVTRILQLKIDLGLFTDPVVPPALAGRVLGGQADQNASLAMARASMTLLQNAPVPGVTGGAPILPLTGWLPAKPNVLVVGPAADSLAVLCGGWSLEWQGATGCVFQPGVGSTIGDAVAALGEALVGANVTVFPGVTFTSADAGDLATVTSLAAAAHVVIAAIGEAPEAETPGDIQDLDISPSQVALFAALNATTTPVVTVLVEPRPRVLGPIAAASAGLLMAYLPCLHGGHAVAEVLFGVVNPSGKLPLTYPSASGDVDLYYHKPWNATVAGEPPALFHDPLFTFGAGLSYSTLTYDHLTVSPPAVPGGGIVNVSFTLSNAGPYDATESVLVFGSQTYRAAITPEVTMLRTFTRVFVPSGATVPVTLPLDTGAFAYWTPALARVIDAGAYTVSVGGVTAPLTLTTSATLPSRGVPPAAAPAAVPPRRHPTLSADDRAALVDAVLGAVAAEGLRASGPVAQDVALARLRARLEREL